MAQQPLPSVQSTTFCGLERSEASFSFFGRSFSLNPLPQAKRDLLPIMAFTSFRNAYEEPQLSEGFSELKKVNWTFEGDEEEKKLWSMWLQIEGK